MGRKRKDPLDLPNSSKSAHVVNFSDSDDILLADSDLSSPSSVNSDFEPWMQGRKKAKLADSREETCNHSGLFEELKDLLQGLKDDIKYIKSEIRRDTKERAIQQKTLLCLTKEVHNLRKEVRALRKRTSFENEALSFSVMPKEPFDRIEELMAYDNEIKANEEKLALLIKELMHTAASNAHKFVNANWKRFMTAHVASQFSWKGTVTKASSEGLCIATAIRDAFRARYGDPDDTRFLLSSKKYFQYTSDALTRRRKNVYREQKVEPKQEQTHEAAEGSESDQN